MEIIDINTELKKHVKTVVTSTSITKLIICRTLDFWPLSND